MKGWTIFRYEFSYQIHQTWPWMIFSILIVLCFLMTRDGSLSAVLYTDFFINSPFAILKTTVFGSLLWLLMGAGIAGDAAARDVATRMYPFLYTSPVSKAQYLGARFLAALALNALLLLAVQIGILLGVYLPGVNAELVGPFRPAAFLTAYAFISLPNAFAATAIQFWLALQSGRPTASYFGSFLIVFMGFFVASFLLFHKGLGGLLDPIGIRFIVEDVAHLWTTAEKNWRLLALEGIVLENRILWLCIGLATFGLTYLSFRFAHHNAGAWSWRMAFPFGRRRAHLLEPDPSRIVISGFTASTPIRVPPVPGNFGFSSEVRQALTIAWHSFRMIATSWAGLAMLVVLPLLTIPVVLDQMISGGVPMVPTTILVIRELTGSLSDELSRWVIIPFLIVFFAGELVWFERDARMEELSDTMPKSEWPPFIGKLLGLGLLLTVFLALQTMAGMLAQVIQGYKKFEVGLYLKIMFGLQLPDYLLFALLALVVHVLVNQKYLGHLVAVIAFVFIAMASLFGIEHNLLIYGASPGWDYTEMRGFGTSLGPWLWFKFYWASWALLLAVLGRLLWVRGKERGLGVRLQLARRRFTGVTSGIAVAAGGLILVLGGFIFYNTNVLNEYLSASEKKERQAEYERRYGPNAESPQPRISATRLHLEIYPERREVEIRGTYTLINSNTSAIDSIQVATVPGTETRAIMFDRTAACVVADAKHHYRIYVLKEPLQAGDSLRLDFQVHLKPRGFSESGIDPLVVENGTTYFTNSQLPSIGYQVGRELISASERRDQGLSPRPIIASLYDVGKRMKRAGGRTTFEAVIGTGEDQIAVAPGELRRTWTEGGRRYFRYSTGAPGHEYAFFSANYAVHEAWWKDPVAGSASRVLIRIFHHRDHTAQLDRMVRSIRASLYYYTQQFGPYGHSQITLVERPGNGIGLHAEAGMISYAEGFSRWNPKDEASTPDIPFAVVAHEMAHQWTVPYANVEGAPVMSESLAWYYAMQVIKETFDPQDFQRFLSWMRAPYRREIRRGEPLLRGLDPYMSYRKGPFALYTLSEYLGVERVNSALRRLLEKHRPKEAPLATTLDLYRELQAETPDSLRYLLHDLFEVNTYWALEAERATAKEIHPGSWQVTLEVHSHKVMFDSAGTEREVPMDDWVEVGIFAPAEKDGKLVKPLYLQHHRIRSGKQTIQVTVSQKPSRAAFDPNYLLNHLKPEEKSHELQIDQGNSTAKPHSRDAQKQRKEKIS